MAHFGVSRFRLGYEESIPKTAQLATMAALDYDSNAATKNVFVVADLRGDYYYTVVCNMEGEYSRVFLVRNIEEGVKTLVGNGELVWMVTGGVVLDCSYIPFTPVLDTVSGA
jgi:hypothetical protein